MFTGLIEATGRVEHLRASPSGGRLRVHTVLGIELQPGDSVAVNGVCLTAEIVETDGRASLIIHPLRLWSWGVDDVAFKDGKPVSRKANHKS